MGATGVASDTMKSQLANNYASTALYLTLLRALTLQATVTVGATTFSVDLSVQAGDVLVFEQGLSAQETVTVSSVTGSGPYTVTPVNALAKAHAAGAFLAHVPKDATTVHEVSGITRTAASWGSPSPAGVITSSAGAITVSSGAGKVVGSLATYSAVSSGTYYDATPVSAQSFVSVGGTYTPIWIETVA
jgi:hypothetical protein